MILRLPNVFKSTYHPFEIDIHHELTLHKSSIYLVGNAQPLQVIIDNNALIHDQNIARTITVNSVQ